MTTSRALIAVTLAVVLACAAACGGGKKPGPATANGGATTSATSATSVPPQPTPSTIAGAQVVSSTLAGAEGLPRGRVFYVESGCYGCDAGPTSLDRVYTDPTGAFHSDTIYGPLPPGSGPTITSVAVSTDGYEIVVAVCSPGSCGEIGNVPAGATITLKHSVDGGMTWSDFGTWQGTGGVLGVEGGKAFVARTLASAPDLIEYVSYPDARVYARFGVSPDRYVAHVGNSFVVNANDEHTAFEQILGGTFVVPSLPAGSHIFRVQALAGVPTLYAWYSGPDAARTMYVGVEGDEFGSFAHVVRVTAPVGYYDLGDGVLTADGKTLLGSVVMPLSNGGDPRPVLASIDMTTSVVTPLSQPELVTRVLAGDRLLLRGTAAGPFVRVDSGSDCLNVRAGSSTATSSLGCFASGVLLMDRGRTTLNDNRTWVGVRTPDGKDGWVSAEFIDAPGRDMTPTPSTPSGSVVTTGNASIDAVIAALATGDPARILPVIAFEKVPCVTHQDGIGAPELCPAGVAEGTPLDVVPGSQCEGYYVPRENVAAGSDSYWSSRSVVAVIRLHRVQREQYWPVGEYSIIYEQAGHSPPFASQVFVAGGKIVSFSNGCAQTAADFLKDVPEADILYRAQ